MRIFLLHKAPFQFILFMALLALFFATTSTSVQAAKKKDPATVLLVKKQLKPFTTSNKKIRGFWVNSGQKLYINYGKDGRKTLYSRCKDRGNVETCALKAVSYQFVLKGSKLKNAEKFLQAIKSLKENGFTVNDADIKNVSSNSDFYFQLDPKKKTLALYKYNITNKNRLAKHRPSQKGAHIWNKGINGVNYFRLKLKSPSATNVVLYNTTKYPMTISQYLFSAHKKRTVLKPGAYMVMDFWREQQPNFSVYLDRKIARRINVYTDAQWFHMKSRFAGRTVFVPIAIKKGNRRILGTYGTFSKTFSNFAKMKTLVTYLNKRATGPSHRQYPFGATKYYGPLTLDIYSAVTPSLISASWRGKRYNGYIDYKRNRLKAGGKMTFSDGRSYYGSYDKNAVPDGKGVMFYPNGSRWAGTFSKGKKNGEGISVNAKGTSSLTNFQNGRPANVSVAQQAEHAFNTKMRETAQKYNTLDRQADAKRQQVEANHSQQRSEVRKEKKKESEMAKRCACHIGGQLCLSRSYNDSKRQREYERGVKALKASCKRWAKDRKNRTAVNEAYYIRLYDRHLAESTKAYNEQQAEKARIKQARERAYAQVQSQKSAIIANKKAEEQARRDKTRQEHKSQCMAKLQKGNYACHCLVYTQKKVQTCGVE
jgi:hypothetical protein